VPRTAATRATTACDGARRGSRPVRTALPAGLLLEDGALYASAWSIAGLLGRPGRGELVRVGDDAFAPVG
jgi:hypothetical protein